MDSSVKNGFLSIIPVFSSSEENFIFAREPRRILRSSGSILLELRKREIYSGNMNLYASNRAHGKESMVLFGKIILRLSLFAMSSFLSWKNRNT